MALAQDILTRIVNVHWGTKTEQQGLVASYPLESSGSLGDPTASAVDSGQIFPGVNMGASGLGYTVLTKGLVCFGNPRDGPACFMAAPDYDIIFNLSRTVPLKRGTLDETGTLRWETVGDGTGLVALTFAGEAFHAVYVEGEGVGPTRIETSFDGEIWSNNVGFPAQDNIAYGGAVAYNGESFAAAGQVAVDQPDSDPPYNAPTDNLTWTTSDRPDNGSSLSWHFDRAEGMDDNPGAYTGAGYSTNQACTIAGGQVGEESTDGDAHRLFVAATFDKTKVTQTPPSGIGDRQFILPTAAAAFSSNGSSWANTKLPGVEVGRHAYGDLSGGDTSGGSYGTATVFVRTSSKAAHFLCSAMSFTTGPGLTESTIYSTLHKSSDGHSWSTLRHQPDHFFFTLSAVARDLSKTKIVHI